MDAERPDDSTAGEPARRLPPASDFQRLFAAVEAEAAAEEPCFERDGDLFRRGSPETVRSSLRIDRPAPPHVHSNDRGGVTALTLSPTLRTRAMNPAAFATGLNAFAAVASAVPVDDQGHPEESAVALMTKIRLSSSFDAPPELLGRFAVRCARLQGLWVEAFRHLLAHRPARLVFDPERCPSLAGSEAVCEAWRDDLAAFVGGDEQVPPADPEGAVTLRLGLATSAPDGDVEPAPSDPEWIECEIATGHEHPLLGRGLRLTLATTVPADEVPGLQYEEHCTLTAPATIGAWARIDGGHAGFVCFVPNALYEPWLLGFLLDSFAWRAQLVWPWQRAATLRAMRMPAPGDGTAS